MQKTKTSPFFWLLLAGLLVLATMACKKEISSGTVVAQVGTSVLTLEELQNQFPPEYLHLVSRDHYLDFVQRWVDDEVLYQKALDKGLDQKAEVKKKIISLSRKLMIEEFLSGAEFAGEFIPDIQTQKQYYELHRSHFRRQMPVSKFLSLKLPSLPAAWQMRQAIRNSSFAVQAKKLLGDSTEALMNTHFKENSEVRPCLQEAVFTLRVATLSEPIQCDDGFYLIQILEKQDQGATVPFDEVKGEISELISMEKKKQFLQSRTKEYKEQFAIRVDFDKVPGPDLNSPVEENAALVGDPDFLPHDDEHETFSANHQAESRKAPKINSPSPSAAIAPHTNSNSTVKPSSPVNPRPASSTQNPSMSGNTAINSNTSSATPSSEIQTQQKSSSPETTSQENVKPKSPILDSDVTPPQ